MSDGRAWVMGAVLGGTILLGVFRNSGSKASSGASLRFPTKEHKAIAIVGPYIAMADSADEALAKVAFMVFRESVDRGHDEARESAWRAIEPLVDRHRYELEGDGELTSDLLDRLISTSS